MGTLRNKTELESLFPDNETQSITPENFRDFVESVLGVGNAESDTGGGAGNGLERIGNRRFRVTAGGDGKYYFPYQGNADIDKEALVRAAVVVNDNQDSPNYIRKSTFTVGGDNYLSGYDIHSDLVAGDEISLEFFVGAGAVLSNVKYMFSGIRQG